MDFDFSSYPDKAHKQALETAVRFFTQKFSQVGHRRVNTGLLFHRRDVEPTAEVLNQSQMQNALMLHAEIMELIAAHAFVPNPMGTRKIKAELEMFFSSDTEKECAELSKAFSMEGTVALNLSYQYVPAEFKNDVSYPEMYSLQMNRSFRSYAYLKNSRDFRNEKLRLGMSIECLVTKHDPL